MKDYLQDIVSRTHDVGVDLVKIVGDDKETKIAGLAEDRTWVLKGTLNSPLADFAGTFGMPNLGKLKYLLGLDAYKTVEKDGVKLEATLNLKRKEDGTPESITFENYGKDFKNSYRFMASEIISEKLREVTMKPVNWDLEFTPSAAAIARLKMQAGAHSEEPSFQAKTDDKGQLCFFFGDHSTHSGNFVFEGTPGGKLTQTWSWPVKTVISILDLAGDKTFKISNAGAAQITVKSGLATYDYTLPAQSK